ncbi:MAG: spermidine/putrescine transporter permease, partial [Paenibacillus sp.]|nr:spermidine/putrescine transporter permease [Paenibacillus sp.]
GFHLNESRSRRLWLVYAAVVLAFLYVPILVILLYSFNESRVNAVWQGWTWQWYVSLFHNERVMEALINSVIIAVISTVFATALGTGAAIGLERYRRKGAQAAKALLMLPIVVPDIVMGISLLGLFTLGLFTQLFIPLGLATMIIAHVTFSVSFVYALVAARLSGTSAMYEEAAYDLGAGAWQTFRFVTLPSIMPGVLSGALLALTLSLDDFMISFFVSGPGSTTLPLYIYSLVKRGISPEINALCTLMIAFTLLSVAVAEWVRRK